MNFLCWSRSNLSASFHHAPYTVSNYLNFSAAPGYDTLFPASVPLQLRCPLPGIPFLARLSKFLLWAQLKCSLLKTVLGPSQTLLSPIIVLISTMMWPGPSSHQGLAKFFCKGPESRHFWLCGLYDLSSVLNFAFVA